MGDCVGVGIRLRFWPALNAVAVKVTMSSNVLLIVYGLPFPHTRITILHRVALHLIFESMSIFYSHSIKYFKSIGSTFAVRWYHCVFTIIEK
ncbi:BAP_1a_G0013550.mRNA.1.CDS.1 [Saccharomyces cerevisiae]|nr:BAP_1a_G0013550.mRNA.1.CDS.1 [Saccharomyces cerevisiae]CAI7095368.1 BAP_1a_G0013550.mRNA.1.CDS.1 [Saccharomyces cerevisiae]